MLGDRDELIDLIYMAMLGETTWQALLDRLAAALPDGKAVFFAQGFGESPEFSALQSGMETKALSDYGQYYAAKNPWMPAMELAQPGQSVMGHRLFAEDALRRTEFYNEFLRPNQTSTSGGLVIERSSSHQFYLTLMSSQTDPLAVEQWAAELDLLSPHLRRAARYYAKDSHFQAATEFGASMLEAVGVGVMLIRAGPRLASVSDAARALNSERGFYRVSPTGRLRLIDEDVGNVLAAMMRRDYLGPRQVNQIADGVALSLLRVERDGFSNLLHGPSVVVLAEPVRSARHYKRKPHDLVRQYGLTQSELRIVSGLLDGRNLPQIAALAGVSHETVRTQQRGLFAKMDVSSQVQLINRIHRDGRIG